MTPYLQMTIITYLLGVPHTSGDGTTRFVWVANAPCGEKVNIVYQPLEKEHAVEIYKPPESLGFSDHYDVVTFNIRDIPKHFAHTTIGD
jgi:hypothetical protein